MLGIWMLSVCKNLDDFILRDGIKRCSRLVSNDNLSYFCDL
ncbi:hypothetical protein J2X61_001108 [Bacillus sp. 3255]|nr:hypothetical protein [Bacillus sp. 3255]